MYSNVDHLRRKTLQLCSSMAARFQEIEGADYPLTSPKDLIEGLAKILSEIEGKIRSVDSYQELVMAQRLLGFYANLFQFFDGANIERTPRALVKTIEFLTDAISPESTMLPSPIHEYNYSIAEIGQPILRATEKFIPNVEASFPFKGPINCISFPHVERDNILLHAVLGHEIGHPIADEFLKGEENSKAFKSKQEEIASQVQQLFEENSPDNPLLAFSERQRFLKAVLEVWRRALEEIISDCVCVILYGPSALFAMYELLSDDLESLPQPPQFYPPSRMRLRYIFQIMKNEGYIDAIMNLEGKGAVEQCIESSKQFIEHVKSIIVADDDHGGEVKDQPCAIALDWVSLTMERAIEFLASRLSAAAYKAAYINHIPGLLERLELGVTPNEIGAFNKSEAVDWRTALLAGWVYNIGNISIPFDSGVKVNNQHYEIINRLTMKSIEYALLVNDYEINTDGKGEG